MVGRYFKAEWLPQLYPQVGATTLVKQNLQTLAGYNFTLVHQVQPELEYGFKHVLLREVVYGSLSYELRTELHAQVGDLIERNYGGQPDQYIDLLAYHYGQSTNRNKQLKYYRQAAERAKAGHLCLSPRFTLLPRVAGSGFKTRRTGRLSQS